MSVPVTARYLTHEPINRSQFTARPSDPVVLLVWNSSALFISPCAFVLLFLIVVFLSGQYLILYTIFWFILLGSWSSPTVIESYLLLDWYLTELPEITIALGNNILTGFRNSVVILSIDVQ